MKARIALAYLGVVLIWTTTPLAIKWSSGGVSYVFGVSARMSIGLGCLLMVMLLRRRGLTLHGKALQTYLAVAVQLYASMLLTYWSAQFVPSGWISVIFGLSPFMTAFMAAAYLQENSLGWRKVTAYMLGFGGLVVMFSSAWELSHSALLGTLGVLGATFIHAASAVWVKRIGARLPAMQQVTGGLVLALPLYLMTWYVHDAGQWPAQIPQQTFYSIVYLGLIATTLGFAFYYYVLDHMPATKVAMMNLLTPILSLLLGHQANDEAITAKTIAGTGLIMLALLIYQLASRRQN